MTFRLHRQPRVLSHFPDALAAVADRQELARLAERDDLSDSERRDFNSRVDLGQPELGRLRFAVTAVARHNATSPTRRRWVGIEAESYYGKSDMCSTILLDILEAIGPPELFHTEDGSTHAMQGAAWCSAAASGERQFMENVARAMKVPFIRGRGSARDLMGEVADKCRAANTCYIFIEDAHMLKAGGRNERLTQTFREMLATVPATFIVNGINLQSSPILAAAAASPTELAAARQIQNRRTLVTCREVTADAAGAAIWTELAVSAAKRFRLASDDPTATLTPTDLGWLLSTAEGLIGNLFAILSECAFAAVGAEESITGHGIRDAWEVIREGRAMGQEQPQ